MTPRVRQIRRLSRQIRRDRLELERAHPGARGLFAPAAGLMAGFAVPLLTGKWTANPIAQAGAAASRLLRLAVFRSLYRVLMGKPEGVPHQ